MDNEKSLDKLEEICSKEENIRKILQAKTKDDIKPLFDEKGIELTDERFEILKKVYIETMEKLKDMREEELEKISGGKWKGAKMGTGLGLGVGVPVGAVLGVSRALEDIKRAQKLGGHYGFLDSVIKVVTKASIGAFGGAMAGTVLVGIPGAAKDLISGESKN